MIESQFQQIVRDSFNYYGGHCIKIPDFPVSEGSAGTRFNPEKFIDLVGCYRGEFFAIECKIKRGNIIKLRPVQDKHLRLFQDAGAVSYVFVQDNKDLVKIPYFLFEEGQFNFRYSRAFPHIGLYKGLYKIDNWMNSSVKL